MCELCEAWKEEIQLLWHVLDDSAPAFRSWIRPAIVLSIVVRQSRIAGMHPVAVGSLLDRDH